MIPFLFPEFDYGYMTAPQTVLNNRQVPYLRGKGLGGSSISNFMTYHYGPAAEYDYWADLVGDDIWRWKNVKPKFHKVN
jgi:choline dehydrogenase-like flavoprotein